MKTEQGYFYFCDEHRIAGTDENNRCCKSMYKMGWYESKKEQEERVEVDVVQTGVL